jgi:hypothetical protein
MSARDEREGPSSDSSREGSREAAPRRRERRSGPLETLYQEFVRRAAGLGLSSFVLTEEALRKAFAESLPRDWVDFLSRQGSGVRKDVLDALVREFGAWLQGIDPMAFQRNLIRTLLEDFEISLEIKISAQPRERTGRGRSLELVRRRR